MLCAKPLYVALAQRKEERKAQLASQFMQKLASIRLQGTGAVPGAMYTPSAGGFFMPSALQNQRTNAFLPTATIPGAQIRGSAPKWNTINAAAASYGKMFEKLHSVAQFAKEILRTVVIIFNCEIDHGSPSFCANPDC